MTQTTPTNAGNISDTKEFDLSLLGSTGFAGGWTAKALAQAAPPGLRVALAGRSRSALEDVRDSLGESAAGWTVVEADVSEQDAVVDLARRSRVAVSTVGPYHRLGLPLVRACAAAGTHYADLSAEVAFVRRSVDECDKPARESGSRIVHSCGFDSIPSDLGVWLASHAAAEAGLSSLTDVFGVYTRLRGGFSGGTIDSLRGQIDATRRNAATRRLVADPYALSPSRGDEPDLGPQPDVFTPYREPRLGGRWIAPFLMAPYNTRVVRRSNALSEYAYGRGLRYREAFSSGARPRDAAVAHAVTSATVAGYLGLASRLTRSTMDKVLPKPGEGPPQSILDTGCFTLETVAWTADGSQVRAVVSAELEPGYVGTGVMLANSGLALALDGPDRAGVLTPATAFAESLAERLRAQGFTLEAEVQAR